MDSIAQRREEILAKKAKLAELKKQRELRRAEGSQRQSLSGSPAKEVGPPSPVSEPALIGPA